MEITVTDMRAAGKQGYVAKLINGEKHFLSASSYSSHGASTKKVTYKITEDGIYEVVDANFGSRKRRTEFVKIQDGEEIARSEFLQELLALESDLPPLEGSIKQIEWAVNIRSKFVAQSKISGKKVPEFVNTQKSASWWISNRNSL